VFYCPESPQYIWDLNHTTSYKIIVGITAIAFPVTILLSLLVIIAVKKRLRIEKEFSNSLIIHAAPAQPEHLILVRWMGLETQ